MARKKTREYDRKRLQRSLRVQRPRTKKEHLCGCLASVLRVDARCVSGVHCIDGIDGTIAQRTVCLCGRVLARDVEQKFVTDVFGLILCRLIAEILSADNCETNNFTFSESGSLLNNSCNCDFDSILKSTSADEHELLTSEVSIVPSTVSITQNDDENEWDKRNGVICRSSSSDGMVGLVSVLNLIE